ncbi:MAG: hypothetical protein IT171_08005, partial [Acidobacteria bacterium]|nr:hypothetical protein [Acidobacteriota bacterium]
MATKDTYFSTTFRDRFATAKDALGKLRQEAFEWFTRTGFPTVALEDWKYTNVTPIANVDWRVADHPSDDVSEALGQVR